MAHSLRFVVHPKPCSSKNHSIQRAWRYCCSQTWNLQQCMPHQFRFSRIGVWRLFVPDVTKPCVCSDSESLTRIRHTAWSRSDSNSSNHGSITCSHDFHQSNRFGVDSPQRSWKGYKKSKLHSWSYKQPPR